MECPLCTLDPALVLHRERGLRVHGVVGGGAVPGWCCVSPEAHEEELLALPDPEALLALGRRVGAVLRQVTPTERLYLALFAEKVRHVHLHVIARPPGLPDDWRGPALFAQPERVDATAVLEAVGRALRA